MLSLRISIREYPHHWTAVVEPKDWGGIIGSVRANHSKIWAFKRTTPDRKIVKEMARLRDRHARLVEDRILNELNLTQYIDG